MSLEIDLQFPESFTVTTGEEQYIQEQKDLFFSAVLGLLAYSASTIKAFVEQRTQTLGIEEPNGFRPSDDRITLLIARDLAIASVLERRDNFNYIEVSFAHYLTIGRRERLRQGIV